MMHCPPAQRRSIFYRSSHLHAISQSWDNGHSVGDTGQSNSFSFTVVNST